MFSKIEAIKELVEYDHCLLTPECVKELVEPFGFNPKDFLTKFQDQRSKFKGLYVPDVKEGDWVDGADSCILSQQLCERLNVKYRSMYGRGSGLRECCQALLKYLEGGEKQ